MLRRKKSMPTTIYPLLKRYNKYSKLLTSTRTEQIRAHLMGTSTSALTSRPTIPALDLNPRKRFKRSGSSQRYRSFSHRNRTITPSTRRMMEDSEFEAELGSLLPPAKKSPEPPLTDRREFLLRSSTMKRPYRRLNLSTGRKTVVLDEIKPEATAAAGGTLKIAEILELCKAECDDAQNVQRLFDKLSKRCINGRLCLADMKMGAASANAIKKILRENYGVSELSILRTELEDEVVQAIAEGIATSKSLVHLGLSSNHLSCAGTARIFAALRHNQSLCCLNMASAPGLHKNRVDNTCMLQLSRALVQSKTLCFLNLSGNSIGNLGLKCIATGVGSVLSLNVSYNGLTNRALPYLSQIFRNSVLRELDLSGNPFGNDLCDTLSQAGNDAMHLQKLTIKNCQLNHEGIGYFFMSPRKNRSLAKLTVDANEIDGVGFTSLTQHLLHAHCKISELRLNSCGLHDASVAALARGMERKESLAVLELSHNMIRDEGIIELSMSLISFPCSIRNIDLSNNRMTDVGGVELVKVFKTCQGLEAANLASNMLTDRTAYALSEGFSSIRGLQKINLDYNFINENLRQTVIRKARVNERRQTTLKLALLKDTFNGMNAPGNDTAISSPGLELIKKTKGNTSLEYVDGLISKISRMEKSEILIRAEFEQYQAEWQSLLEKESLQRARVDAEMEDNRKIVEKINEDISDAERETDRIAFRHKGEREKLQRKIQFSALANEEVGKNIIRRQETIKKRVEEYKTLAARNRVLLQEQKARLKTAKTAVEYKTRLIAQYGEKMKGWVQTEAPGKEKAAVDPCSAKKQPNKITVRTRGKEEEEAQ